MIQRIPKINIPATIAMCITFAASALLVHFVQQFTQKQFVGTFARRYLPRTSSDAPVILLRQQPGAPLTFDEMKFDPLTHTTIVPVRNTSGRVISAYCLAGGYGDHKGTISESSYSSDPNSPFVLGVNGSYVWRQNLDQVSEVWIDFIEFSDGTIWGPNTTRTLEKMNATRMGTRQAALFYSWILRTRGPDAMLASFKEPFTNSQLDEYDQIWRDSFNSGVESVQKSLLNQEARYPRITTSLGKNPEFTNVMRTECFQQILQSYINFRRQ